MGRLNYYKSVIFNTTSLICGIVNMVLCLIVRIVSGSPFEVIHRLNCNDILPPIWIFNLLWLIASFCVGFSAGIIINAILCRRINGRDEIFAYRGGLCFVALVFLAVIWYPLLFIKEAVFLSLLIAILSAVCSFVCALEWVRIEKCAGVVVFIYSFWLLYVMIINFALLFHN